jgi:hypothetical protein
MPAIVLVCPVALKRRSRRKWLHKAKTTPLLPSGERASNPRPQAWGTSSQRTGRPTARSRWLEVAAVLNSPHWLHKQGNDGPFVAGASPRHLALLVIPDELPQSEAIQLLEQIGRTRPLVDILAPGGDFGGTLEAEPDRPVVTYRFKDGRETDAYVHGDWWRRLTDDDATEVGLRKEMLEQRLFLAHEARRRPWVDGLVMPFESTLVKRWGQLWAKAPVLSGQEAVALSGLYLRAHGDFTTRWEQRTSMHESTDSFYRIAAASLLSGVQDWLGTGLRDWDATGKPGLFAAADAVVVRLGRGLRARDYLHVRGRAPVPAEVWGDVLYFFESLLVCLQGCLDAAARFLHLAFAVPRSPRTANWRHDRWWRGLEESGAPVRDFNRGRVDRLDPLVTQLRNAVHGPVLSHEIRQHVPPGEGPTFVSYGEQGIAIEAALATQIAGAASREGGVTKWLPQSYSDGVALIDPWSYTERATAVVAEVVATIVAAVNAVQAELPMLTPHAEARWVGTPESQAAARALVGLGNLPRTR